MSPDELKSTLEGVVEALDEMFEATKARDGAVVASCARLQAIDCKRGLMLMALGVELGRLQERGTISAAIVEAVFVETQQTAAKSHAMQMAGVLLAIGEEHKAEMLPAVFQVQMAARMMFQRLSEVPHIVAVTKPPKQGDGT